MSVIPRARWEPSPYRVTKINFAAARQDTLYFCFSFVLYFCCLTVLQDCHKLLTDSGLKETGEADDDGRERQDQKPAPTLVSLAELPSNGAASQDDFPSQRQLAGQIPYKTDLTNGTTWRRDQHGASLDPTRILHYRPMAALFHLWVPTAAHLRRDELALTLCQWAGMTVEPARTNGKCRSGQELDPCGYTCRCVSTGPRSCGPTRSGRASSPTKQPASLV